MLLTMPSRARWLHLDHTLVHQILDALVISTSIVDQVQAQKLRKVFIKIATPTAKQINAAIIDQGLPILITKSGETTVVMLLHRDLSQVLTHDKRQDRPDN